MGQGLERLDLIASICHAANRAYALGTGEDPAKVYPEWLEAPEEIRESARVGVRAALDGATPEALHESWMATKEADGWTFGAVRDNSAKRHPCMVPYCDLPDEQRRKDALFQAIVKALA